MQALWTTSLMYSSLVPSIPEKSALPEKAVGIPMAASVSEREYCVSILNFGMYTPTSREENYHGEPLPVLCRVGQRKHLEVRGRRVRVGGVLTGLLHHFYRDL